jgi:hypothetical protein
MKKKIELYAERKSGKEVNGLRVKDAKHFLKRRNI